jgi:hypothetical protein
MLFSILTCPPESEGKRRNYIWWQELLINLGHPWESILNIAIIRFVHLDGKGVRVAAVTDCSKNKVAVHLDSSEWAREK